MLDLLKNYSLTDIAIFIVMLVFAIKGVVDFYDWAKNAASGYILKNGEELYIEKEEVNKKLINRDIDFENEECMKVNENYWNNIIL